LRLGRGTGQFLAPDPDGGDRDEQGEQRDPRGKHERTGKADRQGVVVDGRRRGGARLRQWLARLRGGRNAMDVLCDLMTGNPWRPPAQAFSP
jgi:formylmethanofuran dehydrogenase subunit B